MTAVADALEHLGRVTADAMVEVLETVAPGSPQRGPGRVLEPGEPATDGVEAPVVAAAVDFVDGITGGNCVLISLAGAHRLAAAMMGTDAPEDVTGELGEIERSAVAEAANQIMAAAAAAVSAELGTELQISPPRSDLCADADALAAFTDRAEIPHVVRTSVRILGEPAWVVQHVPTALAVRVGSALEDAAVERVDETSAPAGHLGSGLADIAVDVWAELGQARMPAVLAAGLPPGSVVELDRRPDEPIELYVNGHPFARGELVVVDGTDWAFRIDALTDTSPLPTPQGAAPWPASS